MTISDEVFPTLTEPTGSLVAGGWLSGVKDVTFGGNDSTGIVELSVRNGGATLASKTAPSAAEGGCAEKNEGLAYTYAAPCLGSRGVNGPQTLTVDTRAIPDAVEVPSLRLAAKDAAGNIGLSAPLEDVSVDNTPPAPPEGLAAEGGSGWSNDATRTLTWSVASGEVAPVTGATLKVCQGLECETSAAGAPTSAQVTLDAPGLYDVLVHLTDAAGNAVATNSALTQLRYDPDAPAAPGVAAPTQVGASREYVAQVSATDPGPAPVSLRAQVCRAGGGACGEILLPDGLQEVRATVSGSGAYELHVWLVDAAGNVGATTSMAFSHADPPATPTPTPTPTQTSQPTASPTPGATGSPSPSPTGTPPPTPTATATPDEPGPGARRQNARLEIQRARLRRKSVRVVATAAPRAGHMRLTYRARIDGRLWTVTRRQQFTRGRAAFTVRLPPRARAKRARVALRFAGTARFRPAVARIRLVRGRTVAPAARATGTCAATVRAGANRAATVRGANRAATVPVVGLLTAQFGICHAG